MAVHGDRTPEADETFTVTLSGAENAELGATGTATGTILNDDVALLSITPGVSVPEGDSGSTDAVFTVTLSPASDLPVSVSYVTAAGTATEGADYGQTSGTLSFAPGETEQTIRAAVHGDETPEADETFTITLRDPVNAELARPDREAPHRTAASAGEPGAATGTVTIMDDDREREERRQGMQASLSVLGRIVAMDAVDTIGSRFRQTPPAANVNLVGADVVRDGAWEPEQVGSLTAGLLGLDVGGGAAGGGVHDHRFADKRTEVRPLTARPASPEQVLSRSALDLRLGEAEEGAPSWVLWGRGSHNRYTGPGGNDLAVEGGLTTGYVGVERRSPDLLLGLALSLNWGDLQYTFDDAADEAVTRTVRAKYLVNALPYGTWAPVDGLAVWGLLGAGLGQVAMSGDAALEQPNVDLWLAALGGRYELFDWQGVEVAAKTDGFHTLLRSAERRSVPRIETGVSRLRLLLEGSRDWPLAEQAHLGTRLELGGSWDAGEAVNGFGAEVGGGLEFRHTGLGLGVSARGRYLLVHEERELDEWGANLTVAFDPGEPEQGAWVSLAPEWGNPTSSVERLWESREARRSSALGLGGAAGEGADPWQPDRLNLEVGYGVLHGDVATTWYGGLSRGEEVTLRMGNRVKVGEAGHLDLEFQIREQHDGLALHGFGLRTKLSW